MLLRSAMAEDVVNSECWRNAVAVVVVLRSKERKALEETRIVVVEVEVVVFR
jgi:hypothetical protein